MLLLSMSHRSLRIRIRMVMIPSLWYLLSNTPPMDGMHLHLVRRSCPHSVSGRSPCHCHRLGCVLTMVLTLHLLLLLLLLLPVGQALSVRFGDLCSFGW